MLNHFKLSVISEQMGIANPDYYCYLNQSGAFSVDGMDDVKEFRDTMVSPCFELNLCNETSL